MTRLSSDSQTPFVTFYRDLRSNPAWVAEADLTDTLTVNVLALGPVGLDAQISLAKIKSDELIQVLAFQMAHAARTLHSWTEEEITDLRVAIWRSAHRFLIDNADLVDRIPEIRELKKLLSSGS